MPCYHPMKAYRTGDGRICFTASGSRTGISFALPCGQCIGCRLMKTQELATRIVHESKLHPVSVFITLTYNNETVPQDYGLKPRDLRLFIKRLKKLKGHSTRVIAVGEYGDKGLRPHYHAIIFGADFKKKRVVKITTNRATGAKSPVYVSDELQELWPHGSHEIEQVTPGLAGYIARYTIKKINGDRADAHYTRVSPIDGNTYRVHPEFSVLPRRPGLGFGWFLKYQSDAVSFAVTAKGRVMYVNESIIVDGQRRKTPAYYLRKMNEEDQKHIKRARKRAALKAKANNTPARLKVREEIQLIRAQRLQRQLES